jgi:hypothetical protein
VLVGLTLEACARSADTPETAACAVAPSRSCSAEAHCPSHYACFYQTSPEEAQCALLCSSDTDCPEGLKCDPSAGVCLACDPEVEVASEPDECGKCTSSDQCGGKFCNQVSSSDFSELFGDPPPDFGRCTPLDATGCCITGVLSGSSLCIGTGCPPGEYVQICDHFSGQELQ